MKGSSQGQNLAPAIVQRAQSSHRTIGSAVLNNRKYGMGDLLRDEFIQENGNFEATRFPRASLGNW